MITVVQWHWLSNLNELNMTIFHKVKLAKKSDMYVCFFNSGMVVYYRLLWQPANLVATLLFSCRPLSSWNRHSKIQPLYQLYVLSWVAVQTHRYCVCLCVSKQWEQISNPNGSRCHYHNVWVCYPWCAVICWPFAHNFTTQIRQSAAVMLRLRVKKHWKKISPNDRERFALYVF